MPNPTRLVLFWSLRDIKSFLFLICPKLSKLYARIVLQGRKIRKKMEIGAAKQYLQKKKKKKNRAIRMPNPTKFVLFWSLRDIFKEKFFIFIVSLGSFQNSMRESSPGAENYKKDGNMCSKTVSTKKKLN